MRKENLNSSRDIRTIFWHVSFSLSFLYHFKTPSHTHACTHAHTHTRTHAWRLIRHWPLATWQKFPLAGGLYSLILCIWTGLWLAQYEKAETVLRSFQLQLWCAPTMSTALSHLKCWLKVSHDISQVNKTVEKTHCFHLTKIIFDKREYLNIRFNLHISTLKAYYKHLF